MDELSGKARRLGGALEPFAAQVYFSPECHERYEQLGFGPSPGQFAGVQGPEYRAYFCSRGSVLGQVPGQVIAACVWRLQPRHRRPGGRGRLDEDRRDDDLQGV